MLTYERNLHNRYDFRVYLDGKLAGEIVRCAEGWQYWPKGPRAEGGEIYPSLRACQKSLESD